MNYKIVATSTEEKTDDLHAVLNIIKNNNQSTTAAMAEFLEILNKRGYLYPIYTSSSPEDVKKLAGHVIPFGEDKFICLSNMVISKEIFNREAGIIGDTFEILNNRHKMEIKTRMLDSFQQFSKKLYQTYKDDPIKLNDQEMFRQDFGAIEKMFQNIWSIGPNNELRLQSSPAIAIYKRVPSNNTLKLVVASSDIDSKFKKTSIVTSPDKLNAFSILDNILKHIDNAFQYIFPSDNENEGPLAIIIDRKYAPDYLDKLNVDINAGADISDVRYLSFVKLGTSVDKEIEYIMMVRGPDFINSHSAFKGFLRGLDTLKMIMDSLHNTARKMNATDTAMSIVAHDIRGPLSSALGILQFVLQMEGLPDIAKTPVSRVIDAIQSIIDLSSKVLDVSRLRSGQRQLEKTGFKFLDIVKLALTSNWKVAKDKNITINIDNVFKDLVMRADKDLMLQVLNNLLQNALKFTPENGTVTISTPFGDQTSFSVKDTGKGIAANILRNLFRPDIQTTTVGTGGERGTGLGLPYAHNVVKDHGGTMHVTTGPDGSMFTVTIPPPSEEIPDEE